jgi:acyl carrier protein
MPETLNRIKEIVLAEFLPDEDPALLTETTALMTGGVLDSIATLNLVSLLEDEFDVSLAAHEVNVDNFNTLQSIAALVESKR